MKRKGVIVFPVIFMVLLLSILSSGLNIEKVKASETIYIRANGSIDPPTANITSADNVTYIFTGNIDDYIVVERNNIIIDGQGYILQGLGSGFSLTNIENVTIEKTNISNTIGTGIRLVSSSNNNISGNIIRNSGTAGIYLDLSSHNNIISNNTITDNGTFGILIDNSNNNTISNNIILRNGDYYSGIDFSNSSGNTVSDNLISSHKIGINVGDSSLNAIVENTFAHNWWGIHLYNSSSNVLVDNLVLNHSQYGIYIRFSSNNTFIGNTNSNSTTYGIWLYGSFNNTFFRNNLVNNTQQVYIQTSYTNFWDNGTEGNYWSDYLERYPNATEIDGSRIWDIPYVIDESNIDNYPLIPEFPSLIILPLFMTIALLAAFIAKKEKIR